MLAGLTRIIEICYFSPTLASNDVDDDSHSDRTVGGSLHTSPRDNGNVSAGFRAFRHLPPFVSACLVFSGPSSQSFPQLLVSSG